MTGYKPSRQVNHLVNMIVIDRHGDRGTYPEAVRERNKGFRHALNSVLRELVELESNITDPDDLDVLCGDLIEEAKINLC